LFAEYEKFKCIDTLAIKKAAKGRGSGGLAVLMDISLLKVEFTKVHCNYIIILVTSSKDKTSLLVANTYFPPNREYDTQIERFTQDPNSIAEQFSLSNTVVVGDLNARIGEADIIPYSCPLGTALSTIRNSSDTFINPRGRAIIELMQDIDMTVLNGRTSGDDSGEYPYIGPNGSSCIDLCFFSSGMLPEISSFTVGSFPLSHHLPLHLNLLHTEQNLSPIEPKLKWGEELSREYRNTM
jgi:hypothetical protein